MRQPPENSRYGRLQLGRREAEAVQNFGGARFSRITAEIVELRVQSRQCGIVVGALRFGDGSLDATQLDIAVERPVERSALGRLRLLIEMRDAPARRHPHVADFRQQTTAQQREQARLADSVSTDERDVMAGMQREVEVFEQHLAAALQRYVGDDDHGQTLAPPGLEETLERGNAILSRTRTTTRHCTVPCVRCPTIRAFATACRMRRPPAGVSDELKALWWARKDDWDQAHQIVQDLESRVGRERACLSAPRRG